MIKGWEQKTLSDILDVLRNGVNCKQDKKGIGDKISRIESISNADFDIEKVGFSKLSESNKEKYLLRKGDILFSHINSPIHVGKTALFNSDEEVYHGVNLLLMRSKPILSSNYFEYYLKFLFQNGYWKRLCKQSVNQASVNQQDINKVEINYPKSLPEQQRIVTILDEAFASIAEAKANAEQNLKNAKELFECYLQGVFEKKGDGWEKKRFDEICVLQRGFDLPTHSRNEGCYPLVSSNGITDRIDLWKVKAPGVVTGRSGTIGNVHFIEEDYWPLNTALYIKNFQGNFEKFIYFFLKQFDLTKYSSGAGVPTLNRNNVHSEMVWFPKTIYEQQTIVQKLDALSTETKKLEAIYQQIINDLEELKKSILQKAFAGELKTEKAFTV